MRILYLSQYFPPEIGATQTRAYEMAKGLVRSGEINEKRRRPLEAAKILNAEVEAKKLRSIYASLLGEEKTENELD
jgi:hypothetical protein